MQRKHAELRPIMTRVPEGLRQQLEKEAARSGRSMNAEIIYRLERSFVADDQRRTMHEVAKITIEHLIELVGDREANRLMKPSAARKNKR